MPESIVNQTDELIGYILRKTEDDYGLSYKEVHAVLSEEREFIKENDVSEDETLTILNGNNEIVEEIHKAEGSA